MTEFEGLFLLFSCVNTEHHRGGRSLPPYVERRGRYDERPTILRTRTKRAGLKEVHTSGWITSTGLRMRRKRRHDDLILLPFCVHIPRRIFDKEKRQALPCGGSTCLFRKKGVYEGGRPRYYCGGVPPRINSPMNDDADS